MSSDPQVAVVGSYNVGLTMEVPRFPVPGETVIGQGFAEGPGGKGSNQAIAAARMGADALFVGNVGEDRYGDDAVALWEREGVNAEHVARDASAHTGAGFVIVDEDGENEITVAPGANDTLSAEHVEAATGDIRDSDALLAQLEVPDEPIAAAVEAATGEVVLNPAPARELPAEILSGVDYLTPNQNEARILAGREPDDDADDEAVARELLDPGAGVVILTLGGEGAMIVSKGSVERVGSPSVDPVDTTGAGDAFNGALAVALAEGRSLAEAVRFATGSGALAVTEKEVIPALPERVAVEELLADT